MKHTDRQILFELLKEYIEQKSTINEGRYKNIGTKTFKINVSWNASVEENQQFVTIQIPKDLESKIKKQISDQILKYFPQQGIDKNHSIASSTLVGIPQQFYKKGTDTKSR